MYWARALAEQTQDEELAAQFGPVAVALEENERSIADELLAAQGGEVDIGGYFHPEDGLAADAMRPSPTLNSILARLD